MDRIELARPTAAILDGDPDRRARVSRALEDAGLALTATAPFGIGGIRGVYESAPALVFVAFDEPLARAIAVVEQVSPAAPVIAYSNDPSSRTYVAALRAGAKLFVDWPGQPEALAIAAGQLLRIGNLAGRPPRGHVTVVTGAKGGTGKSMVAANLAASLAAQHAQSVLLVDMVLDFGDAGLLLDAAGEYTTARAARRVAGEGPDALKDLLTVHESGMYVLPAPARYADREACRVEEIELLLDVAAAGFDQVVVDTAAVLDDVLLTAVSAADLSLVTTAAELASARNSRRYIEEIEAAGLPGERALPLVNHLTADQPLGGAEVAEILERRSIWEIPFDGGVPRANKRGLLAWRPGRNSSAARSIRVLAGRIAATPERIDRRKGPRRSRKTVDPAVRRRFAAAVPAPVAIEPALPPEAGFVYSANPSTAVYHLAGCEMERRIAPANRRLANSRAEVGHLRRCRRCWTLRAAA